MNQVKPPRAPRRRQSQVDEARHEANVLRDKLRTARRDRLRYQKALKQIAAMTDGMAPEIIDHKNSLAWAKKYARDALDGR